MELRVLQYFIAVAKEQNISAAAKLLHLTQPTLSRQLKELEEELGKKLMIRTNRKIILTEDGLLLQKRAEEILDLVKRTEKEVTRCDDTISGDIYIGAAETDGVRQITRQMTELQKEHPAIRFHIFSGDGTDVCERLEKGLLDFGILLGDIDKTKYSYIKLPAKNTWGVLMQSGSPLAKRDSVTPKDLQDKPLIVSGRAQNLLYHWMQKEPTDLNIAATYNLIYNASLLVEEGMGYAFALDKLVKEEGRSICFRPLNPSMELDMYLVWKKSRLFSKAAELLKDRLCKLGEMV